MDTLPQGLGREFMKIQVIGTDFMRIKETLKYCSLFKDEHLEVEEVDKLAYTYLPQA